MYKHARTLDMTQKIVTGPAPVGGAFYKSGYVCSTNDES